MWRCSAVSLLRARFTASVVIVPRSTKRNQLAVSVLAASANRRASVAHRPTNSVRQLTATAADHRPCMIQNAHAPASTASGLALMSQAQHPQAIT
jgi:hypothetical protein